ncbi:MAG: hypothetical protein HXY40_16105 [Chloroflexi bacterium]|nr:hypothetical protein [Chloroflexota bacterium]
MLARLWRTHYDRKRLAELEHFAQTQSLPTFRRQPGCMGVLFAYADDVWITLSLWRDQAAIDQLQHAPAYTQTVQHLLATGILQGQQTIEVFTFSGGFVDAQQVSSLLEDKL